jgi:hypothetical protein
MDNAYRWPPAATSASREVPDDVASVAQMWVAATYDDLRRAGPDRGTRVRGVLDGYVVPWFGPQTASVGDITYFMVHEWLITLVGRGRLESEDRPVMAEVVGAVRAHRELSLREAAERSAWPRFDDAGETANSPVPIGTRTDTSVCPSWRLRHSEGRSENDRSGCRSPRGHGGL